MGVSGSGSPPVLGTGPVYGTRVRFSALPPFMGPWCKLHITVINPRRRRLAPSEDPPFPSSLKVKHAAVTRAMEVRFLPWEPFTPGSPSGRGTLSYKEVQ